GHVLDIELDGDSPSFRFSALGARGAATVETDRTRATSSRRSAEGAGAGVLVAPMPGRIVRVLVAPGDRVDAGAGLLVIHAMKMENELRAAHAATVGRIFVKAGDAVEGGTKLVELA